MRITKIALAILCMPSGAFGSQEQYDQTTLEIAFDKAFNILVEKGIYAGIFGHLTNIKGSSFCSGSSNNWPTPTPDECSDLRRVLEKKKFVCGYNGGNTYRTDTGQLLLDTTNGASGPLVDLWEELGKTIGEMYNVPDFVVEWDTSLTRSQDTLDAVDSGMFDAACARWAQDAFWKNPTGKTIPRSLGLSSNHCVTYIQQGLIYTLNSIEITNFNDLVRSINDESVKTVCTPGAADGGTAQGCTSTIAQYTDESIQLKCEGKTNQVFQLLDEGDCDAVWAGGPEDADKYNAFDQPSLFVAGSYFRKDDLQYLKGKKKCKDRKRSKGGKSKGKSGALRE